MEIKITGRHQHLEGHAQDYLREKLGKLAHLAERLECAEVVVDHTPDGQRVEVVVLAPRGQRFVAHADAADLRTAIDLCEAKLAAQVRAFKDRQSSHRS
jgi:ribosomal subunit interface protein